MTQITPFSRLRTLSFSHLTFHQPLISLFSVSKLLFLLLVLCCCFFKCESTTIFAARNHAPLSLHSEKIPFQTWKRRIARSPFMHPTVTSFEPARRRPNNRQNTNIDLSRVSVSRVNLLPPMARGQSASTTNNKQNRKGTDSRPQQNSGHPLTSARISSSSQPSHHPMVISSETFPDRKLTPQRASVQHQNDQHSIATSDRSVVDERKRTTKPPKNISQMSKHSDRDEHSSEESINEKVLTNFYEVLEAVGKTTEELQDILRKEHISFDEFLGFIDKGKTRDEILKFLKLTKSAKYPQKTSFSRNEYANERVNMDRQKLLSELPFTEIVHEVPIDASKTQRNSFKISTDIKIPQNREDSQKRKFDYERYSTVKLSKKSKDRKFKEKSYKQKQKKYITQEKNPYLMESGGSFSQLPPQDSPMVIPFLNTKRNGKDTDDSASIISLTIEEKKKNGITIRSKGTPGPIPIRSKIITKPDTPKETNGFIASTFSNTEKRWKDQFYETHPSNLRLVFPMRGILLFCGVLGILTVVTIFILIIYGAVKCNQKSVSENYQMNEHNKEGEES